MSKSGQQRTISARLTALSLLLALLAGRSLSVNDNASDPPPASHPVPTSVIRFAGVPGPETQLIHGNQVTGTESVPAREDASNASNPDIAPVISQFAQLASAQAADIPPASLSSNLGSGKESFRPYQWTKPQAPGLQPGTSASSGLPTSCVGSSNAANVCQPPTAASIFYPSNVFNASQPCAPFNHPDTHELPPLDPLPPAQEQPVVGPPGSSSSLPDVQLVPAPVLIDAALPELELPADSVLSFADELPLTWPLDTADVSIRPSRVNLKRAFVKERRLGLYYSRLWKAVFVFGSNALPILDETSLPEDYVACVIIPKDSNLSPVHKRGMFQLTKVRSSAAPHALLPDRRWRLLLFYSERPAYFNIHLAMAPPFEVLPHERQAHARAQKVFHWMFTEAQKSAALQQALHARDYLALLKKDVLEKVTKKNRRKNFAKMLKKFAKDALRTAPKRLKRLRKALKKTLAKVRELKSGKDTAAAHNRLIGAALDGMQREQQEQDWRALLCDAYEAVAQYLPPAAASDALPQMEARPALPASAPHAMCVVGVNAKQQTFRFSAAAEEGAQKGGRSAAAASGAKRSKGSASGGEDRDVGEGDAEGEGDSGDSGDGRGDGDDSGGSGNSDGSSGGTGDITEVPVTTSTEALATATTETLATSSAAPSAASPAEHPQTLLFRAYYSSIQDLSNTLVGVSLKDLPISAPVELALEAYFCRPRCAPLDFLLFECKLPAHAALARLAVLNPCVAEKSLISMCAKSALFAVGRHFARCRKAGAFRYRLADVRGRLEMTYSVWHLCARLHRLHALAAEGRKLSPEEMSEALLARPGQLRKELQAQAPSEINARILTLHPCEIRASYAPAESRETARAASTRAARAGAVAGFAGFAERLLAAKGAYTHADSMAHTFALTIDKVHSFLTSTEIRYPHLAQLHVVILREDLYLDPDNTFDVRGSVEALSAVEKMSRMEHWLNALNNAVLDIQRANRAGARHACFPALEKVVLVSVTGSKYNPLAFEDERLEHWLAQQEGGILKMFGEFATFVLPIYGKDSGQKRAADSTAPAPAPAAKRAAGEGLQ